MVDIIKEIENLYKENDILEIEMWELAGNNSEWIRNRLTQIGDMIKILSQVGNPLTKIHLKRYKLYQKLLEKRHEDKN